MSDTQTQVAQCTLYFLTFCSFYAGRRRPVRTDLWTSLNSWIHKMAFCLQLWTPYVFIQWKKSTYIIWNLLLLLFFISVLYLNTIGEKNKVGFLQVVILHSCSFPNGNWLPNPRACLTIPLPLCRTPTLLFWSQRILEKSLLTLNWYHLDLLILQKSCSWGKFSKWCLFRWGWGVTVAQWVADVPTLAHTLMLIAHHWKDFIWQCGFY